MSYTFQEIDLITDPDIGYLVRSLRERMNLTQEKFAQQLGVAFASVNRWENGKTKPSPLALMQIEDIVRGLGEKGIDLSERYFKSME